MEPHLVYNHSIECLRFALNTIGYDNCIKELNFIKHLQHGGYDVKQSQTIQAPSETSEPVPETALVAEPDPEVDQKNIVIEAPSKYSRTPPPDRARCTRIMGNGIRCSFKRVSNTELCTRHNKQDE